MELDVAREDRKESVLWWKKKRENQLIRGKLSPVRRVVQVWSMF